jgi:uncharacterized membrane protein
LLLAAVYALHPALHGANMLDFHSLTLVATPLLFALYFLYAKKTKLFFLMLPILLLIREDVSIVMIIVGLAAIMIREKHSLRTGLATIAISLFYVILVKLVFMSKSGVFNDGAESYGYGYYFRFMIPNKQGFLDYFISLITNPVHVALSIFNEDKIDFIFKMLGPLLLLPLIAPRGRILMVYGVLSILLSSRHQMYSIHYQYTMPVLPVLIALTPHALRRIEEQGWMRLILGGRPQALALLGGVLLASMLSCAKFGAIVPNKSSFMIARTLSEEQQHQYKEVVRMANSIDPKKSVRTSLSLCPYVANRRSVYVLSFYQPPQPVDYHFIYLKDLDGISKGYKNEYKKKIESGELIEVDSYENIKLYKRKSTRGKP